MPYRLRLVLYLVGAPGSLGFILATRVATKSDQFTNTSAGVRINAPVFALAPGPLQSNPRGDKHMARKHGPEDIWRMINQRDY